jgi:methionyl-tRNA formyltransferase
MSSSQANNEDSPLKIIFIGSGSFGIPSLEAIIQSEVDIALLVSMPPAPSGRGRKITDVPTATWAKNHNIPLLETDKVNSPEILEKLSSLNPDLIVVCAYGTFLGKKLLSLGNTPPINIHPSLLPKHRGPAPINWALIHGDKEVGVSIIYLEKEMDAGPILAQRSILVPEFATALLLEEKLSCIASEMLTDVLKEIKNNTVKPQNQDHSLAIVNPLLTKKDGHINFSNSAQSIASLINGVDPWPGAEALLNGKRIKFYKASKEPGSLAPGEVLPLNSDGLMRIGTGDGILLVSELQPEGKKRVKAPEFARGYRPTLFSSQLT